MATKVTGTETPKSVTESETRVTDAVETEQTVESAPEKEFESLSDHPTPTELTPVAETTNVHSPMASKVQSGNGTAIETPKIVTESETRVTHVVETVRPVESAPEKEVEPLDDHPTLTELAPAAETTKVHSPMASKVHSGNGIPLTAAVETERTVEAEVKEAPEKRRFLRGIGPEKRRFLLEATLVADHPTVTEVAPAAETTDPKKNWPGSSGECVFRVIVPMLKVESIFGRNGKGEQLINKMCQETKANIRVLKDSVCGRNLIVEVSDKEDIEAPLSPAMDAVIRVFKLVNGFPENEGSDGLAFIPHCSILLLMPLMQVMSLIERRGSPIRTTLENCCYVGSLSLDKVSTFSTNPNDRVVNLYGEGHKVLQALEAVLRHLRKFLVAQTIEIPLVDAVNIMGIGGTNSGCTGGAIFTVQESNYAPKKKVLVEIRGTSSQVQAAQQLIQAKTGPGRANFEPVRRVVDQVAQTVQIPLVDVVGIIGVEGINFGCTSGAIFTVRETKVSRQRITVEIRGTTSQVQTAQQLIQKRIIFFVCDPYGEVTHKPQATGPLVPPSAEISPPSAATEAPVEPQTERMVCSSLGEVPPELLQVQPAIELMAIETEAEVPPELPEVIPPNELMAIETEAEVPAELSQVQPAIETKAEVPTKLHEVQPASEPMAIETEAEVPVKLPQVQSAIETKPDVPTELPEVQPADSLEAIVTKVEEPVVPVPTDDTTVVNGAMQMQVEKSVVRTGPGQDFSGRVQNYFGQRLAFPGPTQGLNEPSPDRVHLHKDLTPTSHPGHRQPMSLPPHVIVIPSGMESIKEPKRSMVCWSLSRVKTFLDACIHEVTINGREDGSLKSMSWKKVGEILKDRHNFSVDYKQMKNYFDGLKIRYKAWVSLKSKTGNKYDPSTNKFNLSDKEWETEMKNKKIIGTLRKAPIPFPNLCAPLFGGTISTGIKGCGQGSAKPIPETEMQKDSVSLVSPSSNPPVKNKQKMGEAPEPMEMQIEESVVLTGLDRAFFGPDHTTPGFFRTGIQQALTGPSLDRVHPCKDPSLPSHRCNTNCRCGHQSRRRTLSPPPHVAVAPSGMESIEESKRHRYHWNDNIVKTFLDACIQEIAINGQEGGSLKAMSWKKVGEMLKASHNFSVDSKQMKNYFDGLKSKYEAWVSLKHKTGNKYDPSTNMFNLTDKEWETEMMENKYLETLRNAPLPFPDLCTQLFDGATSTRSFQSGDDQALTGPEPGEIINEPQAAVPLVPPSAATEASVEPQKEPMVEVPPELPHHVQPATAFMEIETEAEVPPVLAHVQPASELVPIETEQSMSVFEEEILGVLKVIADKMNKPEPPPKPTFEDCEKKLNALGWPKDDPLHLVALTIFCDENDNYRELWMKLNPNLCANWVRMIGRSKRFS